MISGIKKTIENIDIVVAIAGCILSIPLTIFLYAESYRFFLICTGAICFFSFLTYILLRLKWHTPQKQSKEASKSSYLLLNMLFLLLFIVALLSFYLRSEPYTRPLSFFIATAGMAAVIAIEILVIPRGKSAPYIILSKIIILALSLQWSQSLLYPSILGIDPWYHMYFTEYILANGHVGTINILYKAIPGFHLLIGSTSLITGADYKLAVLLSASLAQVFCDVIFIFLIGKFFHNTKTGLMAALFLSFAITHIRFGFWQLPNIMAITFIPIILYLLFKVRQQKPRTSICLIAILIASLIITHPTAAVSLSAFLILLWLGIELYKRLHYSSPLSGKAFLLVAVAFTIFMLGFYTLYSGHIRIAGRFITDQIISEYTGETELSTPPLEAGQHPPTLEIEQSTSPVETGQPIPTFATAIKGYNDSIPFIQQIIDYKVIISLFFGIALIGSLIMVNKLTRHIYSFAYIVACIALLLFNSLFIFTHIYFHPYRWAYFLQVLMAIPVGIAVIWFSQFAKSSTFRIFIVGSLTFALAFLSITSYMANMDNKTFTPALTVRHAFTASELAAAQTIQNIWNDNIGGDFYLQRLNFRPAKQLRFINITEQLYDKNFNYQNDALLLIRQQALTQPSFTPQGIYCFCYDPSTTLADQGYQLIYMNNTSKAFLRYAP